MCLTTLEIEAIPVLKGANEIVPSDSRNIELPSLGGDPTQTSAQTAVQGVENAAP